MDISFNINVTRLQDPRFRGDDNGLVSIFYLLLNNIRITKPKEYLNLCLLLSISSSSKKRGQMVRNEKNELLLIEGVE